MDHPCHRCGAPVPENTPFCSQCGAPQIRVNVNRDDQPAIPTPPMAMAAAPASSRVMWGLAFPRVLLAASIGTALLFLFGVFKNLLPPLLVLILVIPFTGAMGVWFYRSRDTHLSGGKGFRIGLVTGFVLSTIHIVIGVIGYLVKPASLLDFMKAALSNAAANSADPAARDMANNIMTNHQALISFTLFMALIMCCSFILLCGIGGAIAGRSARHG